VSVDIRSTHIISGPREGVGTKAKEEGLISSGILQYFTRTGGITHIGVISDAFPVYIQDAAPSLFELCRRTQQPSLTSRLVGGSTFGLWSLFHLRDGGKWTEMTTTQHGGTLRH
jgi:hypothetical protein